MPTTAFNTARNSGRLWAARCTAPNSGRLWAARCGLAAGALLLLNGCQSAEEAFTSGRIEQLCDLAIPVCNSQASCVLGDDQYLEGSFPGGLKIIVKTETDDATLIVRTLLTDPKFPGTEYQVTAYGTGCSVPDEVLIQDQDLFELAGDDGVLEHHLQVTGRGDHLLELFSDMSSPFLFRVDVDE